jgi:hypothetical protein
MDALIGSTGFVGGHLSAQNAFGVGYNSRTIDEAGGRAFDTVVCAAAPGSMMEANRFPDRDAERVGGLIDQLSRIEARRFVLVSTIAVFADFTATDEDAEGFQDTTAYGVNRRALEAACAARFDTCLIVRLPALFGAGLKKNFLFDILNPMPSMLGEAPLQTLRERLPAGLAARLDEIYRPDPTLGLFVIDRDALEATGLRAAFDEAVTGLGLSAIQFTNPASRFQYYAMDRLWADIELGLAHGLGVLHLSPEPLEAGRVFEAATGRAMPDTGARLHKEDMRTRHAGLWGRDGGYISGAESVLSEVAAFCARAGAAA